MVDNEITQWLAQCGVALPKARALAERFEDEIWVTEVNALKNCVECNPQFLERLCVPIPVQQIIKSSVFAKMQDLSVNDVKNSLQIAFQEDQQYGLRFHAAKINGTVLGFAKNPSDLFDWGIDNHIHAEAFFRRIEQWKEHGVPNSILQASAVKRPTENTTGSSSSSSDPVANVAVTSIGDVSEPTASPSPEDNRDLLGDTVLHSSPSAQKSQASPVDTEKPPARKYSSAKESNGSTHIAENGDLSHGPVDTSSASDPAALPDVSFVTPKKRKPTHLTDPGPRISPRQSVPPTIYSDTVYDATDTQPSTPPAKATSRKRSSKSSQQANEEGKSVSTTEATSTNGIAEKVPAPVRKRSTAADFFETGPNAAAVELVKQIQEGKVHHQIKALNALHKIVAEGINCCNN